MISLLKIYRFLVFKICNNNETHSLSLSRSSKKYIIKNFSKFLYIFITLVKKISSQKISDVIIIFVI